MTGSIKWLENKPFDARDFARLIIHRSQLPGADDSTQLLAVSRTGTTAGGVTTLTPDDLLAAWDPAHGELPEAAHAVPGAGLIAHLVEEAANQCPGHVVIRL